MNEDNPEPSLAKWARAIIAKYSKEDVDLFIIRLNNAVIAASQPDPAARLVRR